MAKNAFPFRFGIRGKVALLVVVAAAASAYLVALLLSQTAVDLLREHELVDLGDEARLRGWEIADGVDGLREDSLAMAHDEEFFSRLAAGADVEELNSLARGLCRRYWRRYLRVEVIPLGGDPESPPSPLVIEEKASIDEEDFWLPLNEQMEDGNRGSGLFVSEIERIQVTHPAIGNGEPRTRWVPVIWTAALVEPSEKEGGASSLIRVAMLVNDGLSPRHLFTLLDEGGNFMVRPDEFDDSEENNDEVFSAIATNPVVVDRLKHLEEEAFLESGMQPQVQALELFEYQLLKSNYFFLEGVPREKFQAAVAADEPEDISFFMEDLRSRTDTFGRIGGLRAGMTEVRMLAPDEESLETLRSSFMEALEDRYGESFDGFNWRQPVVCDEVHAWTVRLGLGTVDRKSTYMLIYAVLDDELASSIRQEMTTLRQLALLIALVAGGIAFLVAMLFIRPLQRMTQTAQRVSEAEPERFVSHLRRLVDHLPADRLDEVGDIARASKRLFEEVLDSHAELENRVRERTSRLARANSDLEEANEQLKGLSQEKDAFVAKVSHDLRQPLNAIFLQVEALKLSELDDLQSRDVQKIHDHAARELNLVNDILEYQKIIMGAETLNPEPVDVAQLMEDLADSYSKVAGNKGIEFKKICTADIGSFDVDRKRLRQVLDNLIGNACKFTSSGSVTIEAHRRTVADEEWIEFNVADTGRGMSEEEQLKAFVPFVSNKKGNEGGTGLGLSISQELCKQMGGKIGFVSELEKGTRFSAMLPCRVSGESSVPENQSDSGGAPSPKIESDEKTVLSLSAESAESAGDLSSIPIGGKVLVVDDDLSVRELMKRLLEEEGCTVATAAGSEDCLRLVTEFEPDAITLDVVMPGEDGWKVLSALKSNPKTESIPVIMVSIMADSSRGMAMGVEDCLEKPVDLGRFTKVIRRAIGQSDRRSILVVDDEADSRQALCRVLSSEGWRPVEAADGEEAISLMEESKPAAILLDLMMPGMDGFEFIEQLVKRAEYNSIPILVVTGKSPTGAETAFLEKRVESIIEKGDKTAQHVLSRVRELLKTRVKRRDGDGSDGKQE